MRETLAGTCPRPIVKGMDYDVIIIGAGPAGLNLARCLAHDPVSVALIEKQPETALAAPAYDGREIALTHHSNAILESNGSWAELPAGAIGLIKDAKVLDGDFDRPLFFDHRTSGKENLGFMVSNQALRKSAYDAVKKQENATLITGAEVVAIAPGRDHSTVTLADGRRLSARLIVAADSRFSPARRMMGIGERRRDFRRACIVGRLKLSAPHDDTAYEGFFYDRTLAVLPLPGPYASLVITIGAHEADSVLKSDPAELCAGIAAQMQGRFEIAGLDSALHHYPLVGIYADRFFGPRFALLGDAAIGMHPVTAHGFNFGLRAADLLSAGIREAMTENRDIGGVAVLRPYHSRLRQATLPLYMGTNALVTLYTRTTPLSKLARRALLTLGEHLPPAKRLIMNQLTEAG